LNRDHWESIHALKQDQVSWYQDRPTLALDFIRACELHPGATALDAGSGASRMVEALLELGLKVTVADIAQSALDRVRERLGDRAGEVAFLRADLAKDELPAAAFDLWHDRAVFHFLTEPADRAAYLATMTRSLRPGGFAVLACFAPDGPKKCSGLPVRRYDAAGLEVELGPGFELLDEGRESHATPFSTTQAFTVTRFRRT
jgi:SAM-dependent methyltransferase